MTAFAETIIESGQTNVGGGDSPGSSRVFGTIRRFIVPGESPSVVVSHPDLLAAAAAGVPHPSIPGLVSVGFVVEGRGGAGDDTFYYVRADYGIAGTPTFDFPPPDRQSLQFLSAGFTHQTLQIDFPVRTKIVITSPAVQPDVGPPSPPIEKDSWEIIEGKSVDVESVSFQIEFNLPSFGEADIAAIKAQANKLHTFYGDTWRFKPVRSDKLFREGVWNIVYRWESDPGHSAEELAALTADSNFCIVEPRPPHARWYAVTRVWPPLLEPSPRLIAKVIGELVPAGYQTLPGYGSVWTL